MFSDDLFTGRMMFKVFTVLKDTSYTLKLFLRVPEYPLRIYSQSLDSHQLVKCVVGFRRRDQRDRVTLSFTNECGKRISRVFFNNEKYRVNLY